MAGQTSPYYNNPYNHYSEIDEDVIKKDFTSQNLESVEASRIPVETEILILDNNRLLQLPIHVCNLQRLRVLSVSNQLDIEQLAEYSRPALQQIPDCISNLSVLTQLILHNNALRTLPPSMCSMKNVQCLDLRMNDIDTFPECICDMESLLVLKLCGNKLKSFPERISQLVHLKELHAIRNQLHTLPNGLCKLKSLEILALQNNKITRLPGRLYELHNLVYRNGLRLNRNPLEYPPGEVVRSGTGKVFEYLKANLRAEPGRRGDSTNTKTAISKSISLSYQNPVTLSDKSYHSDILSFDMLVQMKPNEKWGKVDKLDLKGNDIECLHPNLEELVALDTLILDNNCIVKAFPVAAVKKMKQLRKLSLSKQAGGQQMESVYGHLTSLPVSDMWCVSHLTHLAMSNNRIREIPEEIKHMKNLVELDLMDNKIKSIPKEIGYLRQLKYLGLSNNGIERLPDTIGNLTELRVLRLSLNKLQELPDTICELHNLITLSLSHNQLVYLPKEFDRLTFLTSNDVYNSELLDKGRFQSCLKLDNNPTLRFPSSECQNATVSDIFRDYADLRERGNFLEVLNDAKKLVHRPKTQERQWRFLTDKTFSYMSTRIGNDWKHLGSWLDLTKEELDHCEANNRQVQYQIVEMFTKWRDHSYNNNEKEEKMVERLQDAMSEIRNEHMRETFTNFIMTNCGWTKST